MVARQAIDRVGTAVPSRPRLWIMPTLRTAGDCRHVSASTCLRQCGPYLPLALREPGAKSLGIIPAHHDRRMGRALLVVHLLPLTLGFGREDCVILHARLP